MRKKPLFNAFFIKREIKKHFFLAFLTIAWYNNGMGQEKKNKKMIEAKRFAYKFTPLMLGLCIAVLLLCVAGIIVSVWRISEFGIRDFYDVIKYPFLIAICVFCITFVICALVRSQYVVDGEHFTTQFGFLKTKYAVKTITALTFDRDVNKLTIHFSEEYAVIAVNPEWNEELVRALMDINSNIDYSFTLTDVKKK